VRWRPVGQEQRTESSIPTIEPDPPQRTDAAQLRRAPPLIARVDEQPTERPAPGTPDSSPARGSGNPVPGEADV
jgi:hypothetical protein